MIHMSEKKFTDTRMYRDMIARRELREARELIDKKKPRSEKAVDLWFKQAVEAAGGLTFKMHPATNSGIPDRIVHYSGKVFYVELKATGAECTPLQIEMHKRIRKTGVHVYVLDTKITSIHDLFIAAYTTYESKHYYKNPHKPKTDDENRDT